MPKAFRRDLLTVVRVLLMTGIVLATALFDLGSFKPFDIVKITTVLFFGWLAFGVWLAAVALGKARPRRFLMGWLAGAYLLVATIATIFSPTKATSFIGWYGRHHGWLTVLIYIVIFYLLANVYRQLPDRAHEIVYAVAGGAAVLTLYILMQKTGLDPIKWARPSGAVPGQPYFGTMGNANFAGGYLGLTAPWLYLGWVRSKQTWQRVALVVWGLLQGYTLWLTSARNGIVALAAAIAAFMFINRKRIPMILKIGAAGVAVAAMAVAVMIVFHPGSDRPPAMFRDVDILRNQTIQVRGYWWKAGIQMGLHRPLQGWGPDTFVTVYPRYLDPDAAQVGDAETADKPHNVFVEQLAHFGLLGFGAYIALIVVAFRRAFQRLRVADRNEKALLTTLIALLAGYVGQAFFSIDVTAIGVLGWVILGLIAAVADPPERPEPQPPRPRSSLAGKVLAGTAIALACVLAALSTAPLKADHEARTAQRMANNDEFIDDVLLHHQRAFNYNPLVPQYRAVAGSYLTNKARAASDEGEKLTLLREALGMFEQAEKIHPNYHGWMMATGKAIGELAALDAASFDDALAKLDDAEKLAPYDWRVFVNRGDIYNLRATAERSNDDLCLALDSYKDARRLRAQTGEAWTGIGRTYARLGQLDASLKALRRAARFDEISDLPERLAAEVRKLQKAKKPPKVVKCPR